METSRRCIAACDFPLEKVGNRLRLDADFDSPQTRQEQVHLVPKSGESAEMRADLRMISTFLPCTSSSPHFEGNSSPLKAAAA